MTDVIVIGGSFAGISAALHLARPRRTVLVIDSGQRRNRFAAHAHGLVGLDGVPPGEIAAAGKAQLLAYPTVTWRDGLAVAAAPIDGGFRVELAGGEVVTGRRLVLAFGVRDEVPPVPGLAELWGSHVFHCPYCHGYELGGRPVAVLAGGPMSLHHAQLLPDWGPTTLLVNRALELGDADRAALAARGVDVVEEPLARALGHGDEVELELAGGGRLRFAGIFVLPRTSLPAALVASLGCALLEGPTGPYLQVDARQRTSVPGVFACGDASRPFGALPFAVAEGTQAGLSAHQSLVFGTAAGG